MSGSPSPLQAHRASPAELRERIEAERRGRPFLVFRGDEHEQRILDLDGHGARLSVGRGATNEVSLPWDTEVSRLHAKLECIAGEWTVSDDGLSRNGTYVNGSRVSGRHRLRDGDVIRVGQTSIAYKRPAAEDSQPTQIAGERLTLGDLPPTQRQVLAAVARPSKHDDFPVPPPPPPPLQARRVRRPGDEPGHRGRAPPVGRRGEVAPAVALPALRHRA